MGVLAIVVAGLSEFVDDKDRFFTPDIGQITAFEWGICIWIACQGKEEVLACMSWSCYYPKNCNLVKIWTHFITFTGILGFLLLFKALIMIPPSTVSTLRTSQIIVAFAAQVLINKNTPAVIDVLGAAFIFLAAIMVTFEEQICKGCAKCCICECCRPHPEVDVNGTSTQTVDRLRPQAPGRIRTVSHSLT